jgi:hypothetical protein
MRRGEGLYQRGKTWRGAVLAFLLVALPAAAWADCAWVLWNEVHTRARQWSIDSGPKVAFLTREECEQQLQTRRQFLSKADPAADKGMSFLVCLPDTVDPRGPKGGAR